MLPNLLSLHRGFSHGVHPPDNKSLTGSLPIRRMPFPDEIVLPLRQHAGKPARLLVKRGDRVERGDKIAEGLRAAMQTEAFKSALAHNPEFAKSLQAGGGSGVDINNTEFLNHLDPVLARPFLDGFSSAIDTVFMTGGIVMVAAFVLVWFLREKPLSTKSGLERVADAESLAV